MGRVELYLEDDERGGVALAIRHLGGFDPQSNAHKMGNQLVKYLDEHAEWKADEIQEVTDPASPILTSARPGLLRVS